MAEQKNIQQQAQEALAAIRQAIPVTGLSVIGRHMTEMYNAGVDIRKYADRLREKAAEARMDGYPTADAHAFADALDGFLVTPTWDRYNTIVTGLQNGGDGSLKPGYNRLKQHRGKKQDRIDKAVGLWLVGSFVMMMTGLLGAYYNAFSGGWGYGFIGAAFFLMGLFKGVQWTTMPKFGHGVTTDSELTAFNGIANMWKLAKNKQGIQLAIVKHRLADEHGSTLVAAPAAADAAEPLLPPGQDRLPANFTRFYAAHIQSDQQVRSEPAWPKILKDTEARTNHFC